MKEDSLRLFHYQRALKKLGSIENMVNSPHYDLSHEYKFSVKIRVSKDVPAAMFKPDPLMQGGWMANELTYRALKKDIFAADSNFEDLEEPYHCTSCNNHLDKQFWLYCPYCASEFRN